VIGAWNLAKQIATHLSGARNDRVEKCSHLSQWCLLGYLTFFEDYVLQRYAGSRWRVFVRVAYQQQCQHYDVPRPTQYLGGLTEPYPLNPAGAETEGGGH
jgi:hypothetical protein